jgi:cathepsin C
LHIKLGIKDYYYIGGSYGRSDEESIMLELYNNGPLIVSFGVDEPELFQQYEGGIYKGKSKKTWKQLGRIKPEWIKLDHAATLVGWGEEIDGGRIVKHWLMLNSFGENWGENGYFKVERGVDKFGIESHAEAFLPYLKEK